MKLWLVPFVVVFTLLLNGCTEAPSFRALSPQEFLDGLYSTRAQKDRPFLVLLRLKNPALLETAVRFEDGLEIDEELVSRIEKEQEETIAELAKISPEIKIVFRYKSVLNGLAVWAPGHLYDQIKSLPNVTLTEQSGRFHRAQREEENEYVIMKLGKNKTTSVKFIGAEQAYRENILGQGMRVGVLDSGIDYTHRMFKGEGTVEAYNAINPDEPTPAFPNSKVVGGIDLVGSAYNSGSPLGDQVLPRPDANPIDESGHGTHVAGTIAGLGDGVNTYDGVAPAATLYAIKVFGKKGSTTDAVVIAGLEYAVDPTQDLSYREQLHVVNLSLGGTYGNPHILYSQAIRNVVKGGTVVVASAGNSGDSPYIVSAPSIAEDAISVASSIDNQDQNIFFPAVEFTGASGTRAVEFVEGGITKPLEEIESLKGELVDMGLADQDPDPELKARIPGKIAFIRRGEVSFADKIRRAEENGAIGVIIYQNTDEKPITIGGGDEKYNIPAVMIDLETAGGVLRDMKLGPVLADLKPNRQIDKSFLIDTISDFSSRGPRSEDGLIKPEITAPGHKVISAGFGRGYVGVAMSGTSMAGPHIAGVMTLLKQKFPELSPAELKSVLMGHAKIIQDENQTPYSVSRQGAGRAQVGPSLAAKVVSVPAAISFGLTDIQKQKVISQLVTFKNISDKSISLTPEWNGPDSFQVSAPNISLEPGEETTVTIKATITASSMFSDNEDIDGFLRFRQGRKLILQMPALVVARQISDIAAKSLTVQSTGENDSAGSFTELVVENKSTNTGTIYLFNLLGKDARKENRRGDYFPNRNCDMQSAGYRIFETETGRVLQIAIKLYEGMTTWHTCEVNVQIDADGDNKVDQEIAGLTADSLPGLTQENFISLLLDGTKARELRQSFEKELETNPEAKEDYSSAVMDQRPMKIFNNSTLAIIEADIAKLKLGPAGELTLKISTTHQDAGILEYDDYLGKMDHFWKKISVHPMAQGFTDLPSLILMNPEETLTLSFTKGYGAENLIMYSPQNKSVRDVFLEDLQSQVLETKYAVPAP